MPVEFLTVEQRRSMFPFNGEPTGDQLAHYRNLFPLSSNDPKGASPKEPVDQAPRIGLRTPIPLLVNHPWLATAAVIVHTLGHLLVAGLVALIVYEKLGVRILQRAWFNFDLAWAIALIVSGLVTVFL